MNCFEAVLKWANDDTFLEVFNYDHYLSQIDELETNFRIRGIVGASLVGVLLFSCVNLFYILILLLLEK